MIPTITKVAALVTKSLKFAGLLALCPSGRKKFGIGSRHRSQPGGGFRVQFIRLKKLRRRARKETVPAAPVSNWVLEIPSSREVAISMPDSLSPNRQLLQSCSGLRLERSENNPERNRDRYRCSKISKHSHLPAKG